MTQKERTEAILRQTAAEQRLAGSYVDDEFNRKQEAIMRKALNGEISYEEEERLLMELVDKETGIAD